MKTNTRTNRVPDKKRSVRFEWWLLASIGIVAFFAFAQSLPYQFVYDDEWQVLRNPWIRDWSHLGQFFSTDVWRFSGIAGISNYYRPLHMVAHAVGYSLTGVKPYGYHLLSILLHCACAMLVALFGVRLTGNKWAGAAGGLIFALHPAHAESVAWIAAVTDPLCAVFCFGALHMHLKDSRKAGIFAALLFLGALFSKEMAFTLPIAAVWLDYCLRHKFRWPRYALLAGIFGLYGVLRVNALSAFFVKQIPVALSLPDRFLSSTVLAARYVTKALFPYDLNAFHVFYPTTSIFAPEFMLSALALGLYVAVAWWLRADRKILFLFGFVLLTLLPALNIEGIGENVFADRYLYIPSLGACLLLPLAAQKLWRSRPSWVRVPGRPVAVAALGGLLFAHVLALRNTTFMWQDTPTLYMETMKRSPEATAIAANLAGYYFERGECDESEKWCLKATELYERSFIKLGNKMIPVYTCLAGISLKRSQPAKALEYFQAAYMLNPHDLDTLESIGSTCMMLEKYDKAREFYQAALAIDPHNEPTYNNLAYVDVLTKDYDKAIEYAQKALDIDPRSGDACMSLGDAYAAKGMKTSARQEYLDAEKLNPALAPAAEEALKALETPAHTK